MEEDEIFKNAERAIRESRKVITQAEEALRRTDDYFREKGITPEQLKTYLKQGNPDIQREIDLMVDQTMREIRQEAEQAVREAQQATLKPASRRRFRTMI